MRILFTVLSIFLFGIISGQSFAGFVHDEETGHPVSYASIYLRELESGTESDEHGRFLITHYPKKRIHILISGVGYETSDILLNLAEHDSMTFALAPSHIDLQEVVISAPSGKLQGENIVGIERKSTDEIHLNQSSSLAAAISSIPGVHLKSSGIGIGKPIIRGLSGNRVVVYSQGIRLENQQWGDEHGLGTGKIGIEAIEVIKGPASVLYGADALGGVLYLVDERYALHNTLEASVRSTFQENSLGTINQAAFKINDRSFKLNVFGDWSSHADYRILSGDRVENTRFNEKNIKSSIGFNKNHWITNIRFGYLNENYGITSDRHLIDDVERKPELPKQALNTYNLSWENTLFTGDSRLNLILGYTDNVRQEFEGEHDHGHEEEEEEAALDMNLKTMTGNLKWYSKQIGERLSVILGSQGLYQNNVNRGHEILIPDATTSDIGGFSVVNYDLNKIQLQGGLRADHRSILAKETVSEEVVFPELDRNYNSINFSAGANFQLGKSIFRLNASSGFRAPNTSELLSDGVHHGTNRYEKGNQNLKSERATQIDMTWDITTEHIRFAVSPFYNLIDNYIYLSPTGEVLDEAPVFDYVQSKASLYGGEIGIHYHPHGMHWLHVESNLSTVYAQDIEDNPLPLIPAMKLQTIIGTDFSDILNTKNELEVFVKHLYSFKQDRTADMETPSPDYHLVNVGAKMDLPFFSNRVSITIGAKNIFNTEYLDHLSRFKTINIPDQGINGYLGVEYHFEKDLRKSK